MTWRTHAATFKVATKPGTYRRPVRIGLTLAGIDGRDTQFAGSVG